MTIHELTKILDAHGVRFEIIDNKVIAESEYSLDGVFYTETLDLTYISKEQLWDWLGY